MKRLSGVAGNLLTALLTIVVCLLVGEAVFRVVDGYRLDSLKLVSSRESALPSNQQFEQSVLARAQQYAASIKIDPDFKPEWFDSNPPEVHDHNATFPLPAGWAAAVAKATGRQQRELMYWYNYNFVKKVCETGQYYDELKKFKADPGFVYTFAGPDSSEYPEIRYVPRGWDLGTASYNNFGFRGPDITFPKPPQTIRIAFLGQSTTENGWPWTYPDFVGEFLRKWAQATGLPVQFDIVNGGRAGVGSQGIARIMRYEVASLEPDIIVVYFGAANLRAQDVLPAELEIAAAERWQQMQIKISAGDDPLESGFLGLRNYSALFNRVTQLTDVGEPGTESARPPHRLTFDLSKAVDLEQANLPFHLQQEVADIRYIEQSAKTIGAQLFLTSSVVLAHSGLKLDLSRHRVAYDHLNGEYWPLSYAEIHQGAEFENRAYKEVSAQDHLEFMDIDRYFPQDPDLFGDMIHMEDPGLRLQGWIVAQALAPIIRNKLQKHELPRLATGNDEDISWARQIPRKFDLSCMR